VVLVAGSLFLVGEVTRLAGRRLVGVGAGEGAARP
jgi:hypothetical protein